MIFWLDIFFHNMLTSNKTIVVSSIVRYLVLIYVKEDFMGFINFF